MVRLVPHDVLFFRAPAELRAWLEANHATAPELWVGVRRRADDPGAPDWGDIVDELLCFGWIDSVLMPCEGGRAIRTTPRRKRSIWSARNVARVAELRAEGRMRPAGEAAFNLRTDDRTGVYSFERTSQLDAAAEAAMQAVPGAWEFFQRQPPGYRRTAAYWVMSAKRPETRERRLTTLAEASAAGRRPVQITGEARNRDSADEP
jgi:uncharacterized protein YdeI (YjbR/CyaY-like superfamily)